MGDFMSTNFYLDLLRTGDVVVSTKGSKGIVLKDAANKGHVIIWFANQDDCEINKFRSFDMINHDMTFKYDKKDNRIIKVYRPRGIHDILNALLDYTHEDEMSGYELVYEEKLKEVTMDEVEEKFGCKVKIVND